MYYSEKGPYKRGRGGTSATFENSAVMVHGSMEGSTYHPLLNISVIPQVRYKLAPKIWRRMYRAERARYTGAGERATLSAAAAVAAAAAAALLAARPAAAATAW